MINSIDKFDRAILLPLNAFFAQNNLGNKFFAEYLTYSLPLALIVLWFWPIKEAKKIALRAAFAAILAWPIFSVIIGKIVNRSRPFSTIGVQELVFHRPDASFPSEHAAALFAVSMSFYLFGFKKLSCAMFAISIIVCFFRVATGIHWPTDIIGGAIIGIIAAYIVKRLDKQLEKIYDFLIKIASFLRLA